jgi:hypothetical protein
MKKITILTAIIVLGLATVAYAAATVDEGQAATGGWYATEAFGSHEAAMAIMGNPVVPDVETSPEPEEAEGGGPRERIRYSGGGERR